MNSKKFVEELTKLNIEVNQDKLDKLNLYFEKLIEYNKHTNLTRITEKNEVYLKHFYDSLTIVKAIKLDDQTLLDVGTGAGFPGVVLKIFLPNLKITLLDSLNKRIIFLKELVSLLGLKDVEIVHERAEEFVKKNREKYDIVTSRAVANLRVLSELCLPFVKTNGYFIPLKADATEEINESKRTISILGGFLENIVDFKLPQDAGTRMIIKIKKVSSTNVKYPRKFNEIKKKPL